MWNRFRRHLIEWNTFQSEDIIYAVNDDADDYPQSPSSSSGVRLLHEQRIATRVYAVSFLS
jgi:hypothetical protein